MIMIFSATKLLLVRTVKEVTKFRFIFFWFKITISQSDPAEWQGFYDWTQKIYSWMCYCAVKMDYLLYNYFVAPAFGEYKRIL